MSQSPDVPNRIIQTSPACANSRFSQLTFRLGFSKIAQLLVYYGGQQSYFRAAQHILDQIQGEDENHQLGWDRRECLVSAV